MVNDDNGSGLIRKLVSAAAAVVVTVMPLINGGCGGPNRHQSFDSPFYVLSKEELPQWYFETPYAKTCPNPDRQTLEQVRKWWFGGRTAIWDKYPNNNGKGIWDVKKPVVSNNSSTSTQSDDGYRKMTSDEMTDGALNSIGGALDVRAGETGNIDTYRVGQSLKSLSGVK